MSSIQPNSLPISLEEVVSLVVQLYQPINIGAISRTQETLQKLQRAPQGWQLANSLATHENEQVRFFAALTFIVKINTDAQSLNSEDAQALLQNLVAWLIRSVENSEGPLVTRKLCSTLVAYFMQFSASWTKCIKHLMYCLCAKTAVPYEESLPGIPGTVALVKRLSQEETVALLWFASSLVEEIGKTDSSLMKQLSGSQILKTCKADFSLEINSIEGYLANTEENTSERRTRQEAMRCLQAWVSYAHRAYIDDEIVLDSLKTMTKPALMCLVEDDLYEISVELFSDILTQYSRFLSKEDFELLYSLFNSPWAHERYQRLVQGDYDFESLQFGHFMIAFGDATLQDLAKNEGVNPYGQSFLSALGGLLDARGLAVHEDKIFVAALEFWNTFVENMIDDVYTESQEHPAWFITASAHANHMIESCFRKLQLPPVDVFNTWDSVDRTSFKDARRDFGDMLQQYYLVVGMPLLDSFVSLARGALDKRDWAELEMSMYCLSAFPDCVAHEEERRDKSLENLFMSDIFTVFSTSDRHIPLRTIESFLTLLAGFADYFKTNTSHLPIALNFAFGVLAIPVLSSEASLAITKICSECRKILVPELSAFLQEYQQLATSSSVVRSAKGSVLGAMACVIQAMPSEQSKVAPLTHLLDFVQIEIAECTRQYRVLEEGQIAPQEQQQVALELGVLSLSCLSSIGKGLQEPQDKTLDLENDEFSTFWTEGAGSHVQNRVLSMIGQLWAILGDNGEIVEGACHVPRQGFREFEPGPFVFTPASIVELLTRASLQTPRLSLCIGTACSFISSYKRNPKGAGLHEAFGTLLTWVSTLLQAQGDPNNDPEVAHSGIEFLTRLLPKYLRTLMNHQPPSSLEFLFMYTLKALTGNNQLPKLAAAEFWATLINLPKQEDHLQESLNNAMGHLGPMVAEALIFNISGHALRSELDKLSDPLKKLVLRQPHAKKWIEAALNGLNLPTEKVTSTQKAAFSQKIISLRGGRATNQVVREFWLACRGTNFAYAS